jgi:hypothetical protein
MPDVSSLEHALSRAHERLATLADALGRVDVEQMETVGRELMDVVTRLRASAGRDVSTAGGEVAPAAAGVGWQLERCRRLGGAFMRSPDVAVPAYEPDGRSRRVPTRVPTIEVLG